MLRDAQGMDFLLKRWSQLLLKLRKREKALGQKELGDQLIVDKERYRGHPSCQNSHVFRL